VVKGGQIDFGGHVREYQKKKNWANPQEWWNGGTKGRGERGFGKGRRVKKVKERDVRKRK